MTSPARNVAPSMPAALARRAYLSEIYTEYWPELCRYIAHKFGPSSPEPQDIVQTAFAQFAALSNPEAVENPRAFLYRSVRNLIIDHHRREAVRSRFEIDAVATFVVESVDQFAPERILSSRQHLETIEATIRRMEPKRRTVFVMNRIDGVSFAEISRRTQVPESTVKRYVAQAVIRCEDALRAADMYNGEE